LIRKALRLPFRRKNESSATHIGQEKEMTELNMKFLVVDDFATMRRIVKNILRQEKVDFIISDWNMPHMPGIELLKAVRSQEEWKDLPFLMVTAEGQKENILEAVKYKVSNYIVKPFTPETFIEKINKILEKK
jgi:two-component system chemotaxis response regulator CheY